jgi:hypothetical protein
MAPGKKTKQRIVLIGNTNGAHINNLLTFEPAGFAILLMQSITRI